jgi:hypothetical protein
MKLLVSISRPTLTKLDYSGQNGLYSCVTPDDEAKEVLSVLTGILDFEPEPDKYHCTVMYSETPIPIDQAVVDDTQEFRAELTHAKHIEGHDNKGYVIVNLKCPELCAEHERFKQLGATPTFDDYMPHITLYSGVDLTPDMKDKIHELNEYIDQFQTHIVLKDHFVGDLKPD